MIRSALLLLLLAACPLPPTGEPPPSHGPVARTLRAAAGGAEIPSDLSVTYSDMHGMWGGTTISVSANGTYEWQSFSPQEGLDKVEGRVAEAQLRDLIGLLVELRAWEQVTPPRQPVPDESRSRLRIRAGGVEVLTWEWYNDMRANGRLIRIRERMSELRSTLQPGGGQRP